MSAQKVNLVTKVQGEVNPKPANQKVTFQEINAIGSAIDSHADDIDSAASRLTATEGVANGAASSSSNNGTAILSLQGAPRLVSYVEINADGTIADVRGMTVTSVLHAPSQTFRVTLRDGNNDPVPVTDYFILPTSQEIEKTASVVANPAQTYTALGWRPSVGKCNVAFFMIDSI